jgi:hypothetical protein
MDLIPTLSAIIVIAVIITVALAIFTYAIFKLREQRSPERLRKQMEQRKFFKRYVQA